MEQNNATELQEEILIENRFILEEEDIREYTRRVFFSPFIIGLQAFLGVASLLMLYYYITSRNVAYLFYVIIVLVLYFLRFFLYRRRAHIAICQVQETNRGRQGIITVRAHEEGILLAGETGESIRLSWYDFAPKVSETKHLLFLRTKGYHLVIFKKGAYTLGDEEDLKDLLAAKGFKVK
jgi:hypothetical protein